MSGRDYTSVPTMAATACAHAWRIALIMAVLTAALFLAAAGARAPEAPAQGPPTWQDDGRPDDPDDRGSSWLYEMRPAADRLPLPPQLPEPVRRALRRLWICSPDLPPAEDLMRAARTTAKIAPLITATATTGRRCTSPRTPTLTASTCSETLRCKGCAPTSTWPGRKRRQRSRI